MAYPIRNARPETLAKFGIVPIKPEEDKYPPIPLRELSTRAKYPFPCLQLGECFLVPADAVSIGTLRSLCYQAHYAKKFRIEVHMRDKGDVFEVVRIR